MQSVKEFIKQYKILPKDIIHPKERTDKQEFNKSVDLLIEGEHKELFKDRMNKEEDYVYLEYYEVDNAAADSLRIKRDLTIKDGFKLYATENQDFFNNYIKSIKANSLRASMTESRFDYGNGFIYFDLIRSKKDPTKYEIKPRIAHPNDVWIIPGESGYKYDIDFVFIDNIQEKVQGDKKVKYLTLVLHSKIDFQTLFYVEDGDNWIMINEEESEKTFYDHSNMEGFAVFNFKNQETEDYFTSGEITKNIMDRQHNLNIAETTKKIVLYRIAYPTKFMNRRAIDNLSGTSNKRSPDGQKILNGKREKFVEGGDKEDFYVQQEEMTPYFKEISEQAEREREKILNAMNIDKGLYEDQKNGGYASGKSLQVEYQKTINDIEYKHRIESEEWERFFKFVQHLALKENKEIKKEEDIELEFNLILFKDTEQAIKEEGMRLDVAVNALNNGIPISRRTWAKWIFNMTDEEIDKEEVVKKEEEERDLPPFSFSEDEEDNDNIE